LLDPTSQDYERAVAQRWGAADPSIRSFWQSPVVMAEINRRITGDPQCRPSEHFVRHYCATPRARALSLGCGDGQLERELLRLGACEQLVAIDLSADRLERARASTPPELQGRIEYVCANLETWVPGELASWAPGQTFDLVIGKGVLHHIQDLERLLSIIAQSLSDGGVLYVDEFVGPSRFQWSDSQLAIVNRLLDRLSENLRRDLVDPAHGAKAPASRPTVAGMIAADPSEAARSAELRELLQSHFEPLEEREWGGAIFHLLFNRIMGNFTGHDDLVRVIMELDAILTEERVVDNDCLFGVYGRPGSIEPRAAGHATQAEGHANGKNGRLAGGAIQRLLAPRQRPAPAKHQPDGRIEAVSDGHLIGWAADLAAPDRHLSLDVFVDNKLVRKVVADLPRTDLAQSGMGAGDHGFRVELPSHVLDGRRHYISVTAREIGFGLPLARGFDARCSSQPDGSRFEAMRFNPIPSDLPEPRVLDGADAWAFLCDDANGNLDQLLGRLRFTASDLHDYREILQTRHRELARLGIPYFFTIAPSKEAIHPERLPATTPPVGAPDTARQLLDALRGTPVQAVDLHAPLRELAVGGRTLYYRRDAHWTYAGALVAARTLLDAIRAAGVGVQAPADRELTWVEEHFTGDLADKPTVALVDGKLEPVKPSALAGVEETDRHPDLDALGLSNLPVPDHLSVSATRASVIVANSLKPRAPRMIVYRDSSARWLVPFLASACSWSAWLWQATMDFALIEREQPDLVVQVVTERFLPRVPYGDLLR
jgi:SAM-dependent methyltransferase